MKIEQLGDKKNRGLFKKAKQRSEEISRELELEEKRSHPKTSQKPTQASQSNSAEETSNILGKECKFFSGSSAQAYAGRHPDSSYFKRLIEISDQGYRLANTSELMKARLEASKSNDKRLERDWLNYPLSSVDGFMYYHSDKIKIVPNMFGLDKVLQFEDWRSKTTGRGKRIGEVYMGRLWLKSGYCIDVDGEEFSKEELGWRYSDNFGDLTKKQAKSNLIWKALVRDQHLLDEYVDMIFSKISEKKAMRVNLSSPTGGAFGTGSILGSLEDRSNLYSKFVNPKPKMYRFVGVKE
ncbi:hypothetical protein ACFLZZ_03685 [Nanoarchaeota archaeon]